MPSLRTAAIALACCVAFVCKGLSADVLRVRADAWMPFNGGPEDVAPGYVIEIARTIFTGRGMKIDYQTLGWEEALRQVRAGQIEAVVGANRTEAKGLVLPREPIGIPQMGLFVLRENPWEYRSLESLRGVRLGVIAGYSYWDALDAWVKKQGASEKLVVLTGDTPLVEGLKKLNTGEIDVMVESQSVFVWNVKSSGLIPGNYRMAYSYPSEPLYMAFADTEGGRAQARWFDEGIAALRSGGQLAAILKKYGVTDWK